MVADKEEEYVVVFGAIVVVLLNQLYLYFHFSLVQYEAMFLERNGVRICCADVYPFLL